MNAVLIYRYLIRPYYLNKSNQIKSLTLVNTIKFDGIKSGKCVYSLGANASAGACRNIHPPPPSTRNRSKVEGGRGGGIFSLLFFLLFRMLYVDFSRPFGNVVSHSGFRIRNGNISIYSNPEFNSTY